MLELITLKKATPERASAPASDYVPLACYNSIVQSCGLVFADHTHHGWFVLRLILHVCGHWDRAHLDMRRGSAAPRRQVQRLVENKLC